MYSYTKQNLLILPESAHRNYFPFHFVKHLPHGEKFQIAVLDLNGLFISLPCTTNNALYDETFLRNLISSCRHYADPVAARSEPQALIARTLDRGFESRLRHGCLPSSFYVVLSCVGRGLATS
jgi:hypothetical protein